MITKERLKQQIDKLPEQFTLEELIDSLIFTEKVENGLKDSSLKNLVTDAELESEMKKWFN